MCIFTDRVFKELHIVPKSNPMIGFKAVTTTRYWDYSADENNPKEIAYFESPQQGTIWAGRFLHVPADMKIAGADFKNPYSNRLDGRKKETPGIHCLRTAGTAAEFGEMVVRLSMWGKVFEYGKPKPHFYYSTGGPGYLAEHVRIDAIVRCAFPSRHVRALDVLLKKFKQIEVEHGGLRPALETYRSR